ncbi:hypothetical protein ACFY2T_36220 [Streptomyces sp. NPDC001260]
MGETSMEQGHDLVRKRVVDYLRVGQPLEGEQGFSREDLPHH